MGAAILSFALEAGKIIAAVQMAWTLTGSRETALFAGFVAVLAHGHSPFLRFIPCRSSAVYTGFCFASHILAGGIVGLLWLAVYSWRKSHKWATLAQLLAMAPALFFLEGTTAGFFGILIFAYGLWHFRGSWQASIFKK